jgi:hypothetical protein
MDPAGKGRGVRAALGFVVLLTVVSTGAWVGWGVIGWAVVMLAAAGWLFWRAFTPPRRRPDRAASWDPLVAVTDPINPLEAELTCQVLEREGIPATYFGRANPDGVIPGGGVRLPGLLGRGLVQVTVRKEHVARANKALGEVEELAAEEPDSPELVGNETDRRRAVGAGEREAAAAFGERSGPWARILRWIAG